VLSGANAFQISDIQEERNGKSVNRNIEMLHCIEKLATVSIRQRQFAYDTGLSASSAPA
jgi:hypothetical protein